MRIGGFQPLTLSDFPGHVAAIIFTQGCNLRCPYCHNGPLLPVNPPNRRLMPTEEVFGFLQSRSDRLDGVVISGGEPTIQPDLEPFVRRIKNLGYAVKLDTNGTRPHVLRALLEGRLLDYVAMDVKAPWKAYERLSGASVPIMAIVESIDIVSTSRIEHEFRTTVVHALLTAEDLREIRRQVPSGSPYRLQPFEPRHVLASELRSVSAARVASRSA